MTVLDVPDRFTILQAGIWLLRGDKPIEESIFLAAKRYLTPEEISPNNRLGELIRALRAGILSARAGLGGRRVAGDLVKLPKRARKFVAQWVPGTPINYHDVMIPPEAWNFERVTWNESALQLNYDDAPEEFSLRPPRTIVPAPVFYWFPVTVGSDDLMRAFPALDSSQQTDKKLRHPGGAPEKYDWARLFGEADDWVRTNGIPAKNTPLIEYLKEWALETWGHEPGNSQMKGKIGHYLRGLRRKAGN